MENFLLTYFGELLVAGVLAIFGWGFKAWSGSIKTASDDIINEIKNLNKEFHEHRVLVERRMTRVETKVGVYHRETDNE